MSKILIISAHADDETFGMGGTINKIIEAGHEVWWLVLTTVWNPKWSLKQIQQRQKDIAAVSTFYKFDNTIQWKYKDNLLDTYPTNELQERMITLFNNYQPEIVYVTEKWGCNFEHKLAYELVEQSSKPYYSPYIKRIIAYEIPSSTEIGFENRFKPNYFEKVDTYLKKKLQACRLYSTELQTFPSSRSEEYVTSLAKIHGAACGCTAAEAFHIVRYIN